MILMYLGSLTLILFGWNMVFTSLQALSAPLHKNLLEQKSTTVVSMLFRSFILNLTSASSRKNGQTAILFWNLGLKKRRESVLGLCLAPLGWTLPLLIASTYLGLSGFLILGICFLSFVTVIKNYMPKALWPLLMGLGLFLVGSEMGLRQAPLLLNLLGTGETAFFLADGRFGAVLFFVAAGFLLSFILNIEKWSLILALTLLVTNVISLNGALGLIVGELLYLPVILAIKTRTLSATPQRVIRIFAATSIFGILLGFWAAGEMRSLLDLGFSSSFSAFQERIFQILFLTTVVLFVQTVVQMTLGHFLAQERMPDGLEPVVYLDPNWRSDLSPVVKTWMDARISQRLSEIRYHIQGLQSLPPGKIPDPLQKRLIQEEKELSQFSKNP